MSCKSFLSPNKFKFSINSMPAFSEYVSGINVPGLELANDLSSPTMFHSQNVPSGKIEFDKLTCKFKVASDMSNWIELYNWLIGLGKPVSFTQYAALDEIQEDASLHILNAFGDAALEFKFIDLNPISLSGFDMAFDIDNGSNYVSAEVTFKYSTFSIKTVVQ